MPIPAVYIVEAAKIIGSALLERENNSAKMSEFAALLAANNAVILSEMRGIINRAFSEQKAGECRNRLETLTRFYGEYSNNPDDFDKLVLIEQESQFLLNTLDDEDIRLPGIRNYLCAASLRINALLLKSNFQPGDRQNAKQLAEDSIGYAEAIKPQLVEAAESRVGPANIASFSGTPSRSSDFVSCSGQGFFSLDSNTVSPVDSFSTSISRIGPNGDFLDFAELNEKCRAAVASSSLRSRTEQRREAILNEVRGELPFPEIDACITAWRSLITQL